MVFPWKYSTGIGFIEYKMLVFKQHMHNTHHLLCISMVNIYQLNAIADKVERKFRELTTHTHTQTHFTTQLHIWLIRFWWPLINV